MLGRYPASYTISLTELTTNKSKTVEVKRKGDRILTHRFSNALEGALYNISIATTAKNAEAVSVRLHGPALPAVRQIKVNQEKNGTYVVYWHDIMANDKRLVDIDIHLGFQRKSIILMLLSSSFQCSYVCRLTYDYELIVMPGLVLNHSLTPTLKKMIKRPPMWIHPVELGGSEAAGKTFTIGVRLKTSEVSQ